MSCLFISLTVSFDVQGSVSLMQDSPSIMDFVVCAVGIIFKTYCLVQFQKAFTPYFIVLGPTLKSLICSELTFTFHTNFIPLPVDS